MDRLRQIFETCGMKNVKTYIQSGNIFFDSNIESENTIIQKIEKELHKELNQDVILVIRTVDEIKTILEKNPFDSLKLPASTKHYVSFLKEKVRSLPDIPPVSEKKDVEIIHISGREIYSITREINGRFGFPNNFIEAELNIKATTRNWNTLNKVAELITK
jgi:uncharacterized protein (DUF1697 family)